MSLVNPDEAVALGAAIHAGSLEGSIENVQTLNSMQASLIRALTAKMKRDDTDERLGRRPRPASTAIGTSRAKKIGDPKISMNC